MQTPGDCRMTISPARSSGQPTAIPKLFATTSIYHLQTNVILRRCQLRMTKFPEEKRQHTADLLSMQEILVTASTSRTLDKLAKGTIARKRHIDCQIPAHAACCKHVNTVPASHSVRYTRQTGDRRNVVCDIFPRRLKRHVMSDDPLFKLGARRTGVGWRR